jgi:hypothetical protein
MTATGGQHNNYVREGPVKHECHLRMFESISIRGQYYHTITLSYYHTGYYKGNKSGNCLLLFSPNAVVTPYTSETTNTMFVLTWNKNVDHHFVWLRNLVSYSLLIT